MKETVPPPHLYLVSREVCWQSGSKEARLPPCLLPSTPPALRPCWWRRCWSRPRWAATRSRGQTLSMATRWKFVFIQFSLQNCRPSPSLMFRRTEHCRTSYFCYTSEIFSPVIVFLLTRSFQKCHLCYFSWQGRSSVHMVTLTPGQIASKAGPGVIFCHSMAFRWEK